MMGEKDLAWIIAERLKRLAQLRRDSAEAAERSAAIQTRMAEKHRNKAYALDQLAESVTFANQEHVLAALNDDCDKVFFE